MPHTDVSAQNGNERRPTPHVPQRLIVEDRLASNYSQNSIGTAFATQTKDVWITAAHVVRECKHVFLNVQKQNVALPYLQTQGGKKLFVVEAKIHKQAEDSDLATLVAPHFSSRYMMIASPINYNIANNQKGFAIGFPAGSAGEVTGHLIGKDVGVMRLGQRSIEQPLLVWAIDTRNPSDLASLGGISGGPLVNAHGEVVGVNTAENDRRGRLYTSQPEALERLSANDIKIPASGTTVFVANPEINDASVLHYANSLRQQDTVTKVICLRNK